MTRLVLASASPARLAVLRAAGLHPEVVVSDVDEDAVLAAVADRPVVDRLALLAGEKAQDSLLRSAGVGGEELLVLGCDSMLELDGQLLGKPHTADVARERWRAMSGRTGRLHTGHAVIWAPRGDGWHTSLDTRSTTVRFASVSDAQIDAYVATGEPLEVAGAFTLDGYGGWFVDSIDGDPSNVLGISLPLLRTMLEQLGFPVIDLWAPGPPDRPPTAPREETSTS